MKPYPTNYRRGVTLFEVLLVIAVILVLAVVFLPILARTHRRTSSLGCINLVKQVQLSFKTWSVDNGDKYPMQISTTSGGTMELIASGHVFRHFQAISNELSTPRFLNCPEDMTRRSATNFENDFDDTKVSYFVGVDANDTNPASFFIGDSHLAIGSVPVKSGLLFLSTNDAVGWTSARHQTQGNIGLADGSVQQATSSQLQKLLIESGLATNRISIP